MRMFEIDKMSLCIRPIYPNTVRPKLIHSFTITEEKKMLTEKTNKTRPRDTLGLSLFLSLSLQNVLTMIELMKDKEKEWALEQVCKSAELLFQTPFEA